jgi:hypothetical protein
VGGHFGASFFSAGFIAFSILTIDQGQWVARQNLNSVSLLQKCGLLGSMRMRILGLTKKAASKKKELETLYNWSIAVRKERKKEKDSKTTILVRHNRALRTQWSM